MYDDGQTKRKGIGLRLLPTVPCCRTTHLAPRVFGVIFGSLAANSERVEILYLLVRYRISLSFLVIISQLQRQALFFSKQLLDCVQPHLAVTIIASNTIAYPLPGMGILLLL